MIRLRTGLPLIGMMLMLAASGTRAQDARSLEDFPDVLDLHVTDSVHWGKAPNAFFDQGAWCGYSLPVAAGTDFGFVGPVMPADGRPSTAERLAVLEMVDAETHRPLTGSSVRSSALPGRLVEQGTIDGIDVRETLLFANADDVLVRIELQANRPRRIGLAVRGGGAPGARYEVSGGAIVETQTGTPFQLRTSLIGDPSRARIDADGHTYQVERSAVLELPPGVRVVVHASQSCRLDAAPGRAFSPEDVFAGNASRWNGYLNRIFASRSARLTQPRYRRVAVKALETLLGNWRSPRGDLLHDGLLPSYSNPDFDGFWSWDSWKHAIALAHFAPELARAQIEAMFDYQADSGMIPDVIYRDKTQNNWRDTKPPLASLAVWEVYSQTHDLDFVRAMFPRLLRYHRWWYADRDHGQEGLAEYGSTDGTLVAAAWESGMDNAARFDHTHLVRNGPKAWSMDQQSADLNSYLYVEKQRLAQMARLLGDPRLARDLLEEAARLRTLLRVRFYDSEKGYFRDVSLEDRRYVGGAGPESWIPLWAQVATPAQADGVVRALLDPGKFSTYMPFPTLSVDDPEFAPRKGYWRGPVWIDQAYFAIRGLENYGRTAAAAALRRRLLDRAFGLTDQAPVFENYHPRTGEGLNSPNFSWSAAYFLLLVSGV